MSSISEDRVMQHLSQTKNQIMTWTRREGRHFELTSGDHVFADLSWHSMFGSLAIGATADGQWTIKRVGFFRPRVTVRLPDHDADFATLQYSRYGESVLQLNDGSTYRWKATKRRRSERGFFTADGRLVVSCIPRTKWFRFEADMLIEPGQEMCRDVSLLVLLGWYRLVLEHDDDNAAAAAACCAVT
jgi:hypothetical protein